MKQEQYRMMASLERLGFTWEEANKLRRISLTLCRWFELECGTEGAGGSTHSIERDNNGEGKPFYRVQYMDRIGQWMDNRTPIADKEAGARKRLAAIMAGHKRLLAYVQRDPRGAALHILRKSDVKAQSRHSNKPESEVIHSMYNRGVAVY